MVLQQIKMDIMKFSKNNVQLTAIYEVHSVKCVPPLTPHIIANINNEHDIRKQLLEPEK